MSDSSDFLAIASHELRTPITILRGYAEVLQEHPERTSEIAGKIVSASIRLENVLQALLRLADIEQVGSFRQVKLLPLLEACKRTVLLTHPEARISIECDALEAEIAGDVDLLELAVINVLENGIKYSEEPALIAVRLTQEGTEAKISFQDSGIGIAAQDLPHIFQPFFAVNKARSRKLGGAGLGLTIVKAIVEKHRGSIHVVSKPGQGSLFTAIFRD